jgi:orotidine-5'-phosphate decarboxylase
MTTYPSICTLCKRNKRIESFSQFVLMVLENKHVREKHLEIFKHNQKVNEKYNKLRKKAEDYKIFNEKRIFKRLEEENP